MLVHNKVSMKYDKDHIADIIKLLSPDNALIIFESREMSIANNYANIRYK